MTCTCIKIGFFTKQRENKLNKWHKSIYLDWNGLSDLDPKSWTYSITWGILGSEMIAHVL